MKTERKNLSFAWENEKERKKDRKRYFLETEKDREREKISFCWRMCAVVVSVSYRRGKEKFFKKEKKVSESRVVE